MTKAANWNPDGCQWAYSKNSELLDGWNLDEMGFTRGILMLFGEVDEAVSREQENAGWDYPYLRSCQMVHVGLPRHRGRRRSMTSFSRSSSG